MEEYKYLVGNIIRNGERRPNRTGIDTISCFGKFLQHDMSKGLPILTTKKINIKACIHELLWFLSGDTNIKYLNDNGVHIWDAWADKNGDLGPVYGKQWVDCDGINQVQQVIDEIKNNPYSRRLIINAWNPRDLDKMALPPCHILYQFYAKPETKQLSLIVYMRSADMFLGVPFDIAEGGLLLSLVAKVTGYIPDKLKYYFGDAHIYINHLDIIRKQILHSCYALPTLELPFKESIFDYTYEDFSIIGYKSHGYMKGEVAI